MFLITMKKMTARKDLNIEEKISKAYFDYSLKENRLWFEVLDNIGEVLSEVKVDNPPKAELYYMDF